MNFKRFPVIFTVFMLFACSHNLMASGDGRIFAQVGPSIVSGVEATQQDGFIEGVEVETSGGVYIQGGYMSEFGRHVSVGGRLSYTKVEYEFKSDVLTETAIDESSLVLLQALVEYRINPKDFSPVFGLSGGFVFGGPDLPSSGFVDDDPSADFIFGVFGGVLFPIAPELSGYVTIQGDFPLSSDILPNAFGLMAGIAFELD